MSIDLGTFVVGGRWIDSEKHLNLTWCRRGVEDVVGGIGALRDYTRIHAWLTRGGPMVFEYQSGLGIAGYGLLVSKCDGAEWLLTREQTGFLKYVGVEIGRGYWVDWWVER